MRYALIMMALAAGTAGCASLQPSSASTSATDSTQLLTVDHYVRVRSTAPSMNGQTAQLYVRERVESRSLLRGPSGVVLFVHGAGTPAEVAFDVPAGDYSWMAFLARAGFDVFSMDTTGYGRSTRPTAMNDPCNLSRNQQRAFIPALLPAPCDPTAPAPATTIASDWHDIDAVVDYLRALRRVDRVHMVAWSQGGSRAGGYAIQHPDKVQRLVFLTPGYNRTSPATQPASSDRALMNTQSREEFVANWERQVGCPNQYDTAVLDSVWSTMQQSDPVGATWGPGVRRAPEVPVWGWNAASVPMLRAPTLMVAGIHDKQVAPERVRDLYADLGSPEKVIVDLGCASHNAMWERNHTLLFEASLEWLAMGTVNGMKTGVVRMGYDQDQKRD